MKRVIVLIDNVGVFLNRGGVVRLLPMINKQCKHFRLTDN